MTDKPQTVAYRWRYLRTLLFFGGLVIALLWWEVVLKAIIGRPFVAKNRLKRLRRYAHTFRGMAVSMGGVMIKLGQFFSARVDVLPDAVIEELAGLQDEVPPANFEDVRAALEEDLGPLNETFAGFNTQAHAAASLGQVYRARLHNGDRVVVKVQRPDIQAIVGTDLAALVVVGRWAMLYRPIRRRADVPALLEEFAATTWAELDYLAEASNAERFHKLFENDMGVYIPEVYRDLTTVRTLTLEDVTTLKISDHAAMDEAGINREEVARRLFDLYMRQIFNFRFFHADPHPGNIFVYPLPVEAGTARNGKRPFYLIFVDFGMVGHVTEKMVTGLREMFIAVATGDMRHQIKAFETLDVLLPGTDTDRLMEVEQQMFDRFYGMDMQQIRQQIDFKEMRQFTWEFRDVLFEMPMQVPQNFIFLGRAMSILSGMCTSLNSNFNPWEAILPHAERMAREEMRRSVPALLASGAQRIREAVTGAFARTPPPEVAPAPAPPARRDRFAAYSQLALGLVGVTLLAAGTMLVLNGERLLGLAGYGLALASAVVVGWRWLRGVSDNVAAMD